MLTMSYIEHCCNLELDKRHCSHWCVRWKPFFFALFPFVSRIKFHFYCHLNSSRWEQNSSVQQQFDPLFIKIKKKKLKMKQIAKIW